MKRLVKRTGRFVLGLTAVGLFVFLENHSWARDLKKDQRWHTEIVEDEEYTGEIETTRRVGDRRKTRRTDQTVPPSTDVLTAQPEGTSVQEGDPSVKTTGVPGPNVVPPVVRPAESGPEGPAGADQRDNLEAAKEMLEKQLERLRKVREEREKAVKPTVATGERPQQENQATLLRDVITLFIDPLEARPEVGKRFASTVRIENHSAKEFDEFGFVLHYNPQVLRVVDGEEGMEGINVHDRSFRDAFPWEQADEYLNRVDQANGLVTYHAKLPEGEALTTAGTVAAVTFEVIKGVDSDLAFLFDDPLAVGESGEDEPLMTYVHLRGEDVLGRQSDPEDGALNATVKFHDYLVDGEAGDLPSDKGEDLLTRIVMYPTVEFLYPGQEFDYVVEIDNPNRVEFDEVTLVLGYNPRYLKPIDHDKGNYISKGVNLFDGDYHETFPFNHHRRNEVDMQRGVILYQMGALRMALNSSGVLGLIRFRALAPSGEQGTRLKVGFVKGWLESGLTRHGRDVLGDAEEWKDGFEVYPVYLLPHGVSQK